MPVRRFLAAANPADADAALEQLGGLTLSDWLWAGGLAIGSALLALLAFRLVVRVASSHMAPLAARLIGRVVQIVTFVFGLFYALQQVGISAAPFLGVLGLLGVALAFAFQDVFENFIAGIFLSARRPFSQGDEISTAGHEGVVEDVSLRELTMRTYDGERVFIPNASVWQNPIVNHTAEEHRRTTLSVGVAYDSNLREVGNLLVHTMKSVEGVAADPAPQAYAHEFADSSINFALRFWHEAAIAKEWAVRDAVASAVHEALNDADVEIPFPQRVVEIIREPDAA